MKLTRSQLQQIIKEELAEMATTVQPPDKFKSSAEHSADIAGAVPLGRLDRMLLTIQRISDIPPTMRRALELDIESVKEDIRDMIKAAKK